MSESHIPERYVIYVVLPWLPGSLHCFYITDLRLHFIIYILLLFSYHADIDYRIHVRLTDLFLLA